VIEKVKSEDMEPISVHNLKPVAQMMLELWPDSSLEEELESCKGILNSKDEACYLLKNDEVYVAFIHVTLRHDYVEGAETSPVGYIEGIYVREAYRHLGLGRQLIIAAEDWAKQKGCKQLASDTALDQTASIEFHKRSGFSEVNRIVCFIKEL